jgi:hypothetical protein
MLSRQAVLTWLAGRYRGAQTQQPLHQARPSLPGWQPHHQPPPGRSQAGRRRLLHHPVGYKHDMNTKRVMTTAAHGSRTAGVGETLSQLSVSIQASPECRHQNREHNLLVHINIKRSEVVLGLCSPQPHPSQPISLKSCPVPTLSH